MAIKPIQILINAKDNASSVFDKLQGKVAAVGIAIAGYFGIQAFTGIVQGAADFEQAMSRVQAATGGTAEEMAALRKAAEDAGSTSIFTSAQAAAALENLAKAGLTASEAIAALPGVMVLAQAGDVELATSAEFITKAVMGMGLAFSDAGRVADVLAKGANATNTSVTGLAQALSYAAPVAQSLGLSLEQTVAIIGKFADAGIDASRAGTALNSILSQFANPASKFRQELAASGITTTNFGQALEQLAVAGPRGQKAVLAVGQEAGPALRALLNQGIGSLHDLQTALEGSAGSADEVARTMQGNLNGAINGLSSAWDTVKNTLGTPVLPVLRQGVDQLAAALRGAVADGTIQKFGEAIASAFRSGIEWVTKFVGAVDFTQLAADMRAFADRTAEVFTEIGQYASNAGNSVRLAYGVMSSGVNVVLTAIYGIGTAFAEVASKVMSGIALLREGLAKVSFGSLSESFRLAAEDARESAGAFGAVADAMQAKAMEAMDKVAEGAETSREAWAGLTTEFEKTGKAASGSAESLAAIADEIEKVGREAAAARQATEDKASADESAARAVKQLRDEYRELIGRGDLQAAAEKIREINTALSGTPGAAAAAASASAASAEAIAAAFERMGIQSKDALTQAAATAKADFELIKQSGQATAEGLEQAFQKYAEAAISANGGVATESLKAEAAMRGLAIESDRAGKAIVRAMRDGSDAAGYLAGSIQQASAAAAEYVGWADRMAERNSKVQSSMKTDGNGFATDASGNAISAGGDLTTLTGITNFLKSAGLDEATARSIAREFSDSKGDIPYFSNPGQLKYGGQGSTMSSALLKAAERSTFGIGQAGAAAVGRTVNVNLAINDKGFGAVDTSDSGAANLQSFLDELGRSRGAAS